MAVLVQRLVLNGYHLRNNVEQIFRGRECL